MALGYTCAQFWDFLKIFLFPQIHTVLQSISPTLKYWPHLFLPSPTPKVLNLYMIIAIIYIIFLCDISSAVKNYFQQILSPLEKFHSPLFTHSPLKIQKVHVPSLFANIEKFSAPPLQKGGRGGDTEILGLESFGNS